MVYLCVRYDPVELDPEVMCQMARENPQELANYSVSGSSQPKTSLEKDLTNYVFVKLRNHPADIFNSDVDTHHLPCGSRSKLMLRKKNLKFKLRVVFVFLCHQKVNHIADPDPALSFPRFRIRIQAKGSRSMRIQIQPTVGTESVYRAKSLYRFSAAAVFTPYH